MDANVLLEVILERPKAQPVKTLLRTHAGTTCISTLTVHLIAYFSQKVLSLPGLQSFLQDYTIFDLTNQDVAWAFQNIRGKDFEDALQLAVAIRNGAEQFVTLDQPLLKNYVGLPNIQLTSAA